MHALHHAHIHCRKEMSSTPTSSRSKPRLTPIAATARSLLPLIFISILDLFQQPLLAHAQGTYRATAVRLLNDPLVSPQNSPFTYNYNPALFYDTLTGRYCLLVRCQNQTSSSPYDIGPSYILLTHFLDPPIFTKVEPLTPASVVLSPRSSTEDGCGDEDPRASVAAGSNSQIKEKHGDTLQHSEELRSSPVLSATSYPNKTHPLSNTSPSTLFVTFTAYNCQQPNLALATVSLAQASNASAYVRHGTLVQNSKSAGLLLRPPSQSSYMYFGGGVIEVAESNDGGYTWGQGKQFFTPRKFFFDSDLVEGGPAPLPLSDGNLFYVYNSDTNSGPPSRKPGWSTSYHCAWAVLNGSDPAAVLQRSDIPLLSPELPWEQDQPGLLTPNVVFCEGMVAHPTEKDKFIFVYGAGDSFVGVGEITVSVPPPSRPITLQRARTTPLLPLQISPFTYVYDPGLYLSRTGNIELLPRVRNTTVGSFGQNSHRI